MVPGHFDAEVYAALRRLFRRGFLLRERLDVTVAGLGVLAAQRVALAALLAEAHALADRVGPMDAFYVALARLQDGELVTSDGPLARAALGLTRVRLVASA